MKNNLFKTIAMLGTALFLNSCGNDFSEGDTVSIISTSDHVIIVCKNPVDAIKTQKIADAITNEVDAARLLKGMLSRSSPTHCRYYPKAMINSRIGRRGKKVNWASFDYKVHKVNDDGIMTLVGSRVYYGFTVHDEKLVYTNQKLQSTY